MTEDEKIKQLDEFAISIELPLKAWNMLLNACNMPSQTPSMGFADLIMAIQKQAGPQAEKAKKALDVVLEKVSDE
jgi:hypothetical protein